jgi:hypothetical protein
MTRIVPAFLLPVLFLLAAPAAAADRTYSVTDFDRIQVDGPYEVTLVTGRSSGARAIGSSPAIENITVEVQGQTLKIHANRSVWGSAAQQAGPVRIEATTRDLAVATVIGAGSLSIDRARGLRLALTVSGSGRLSVGRLEADTLIVALRGSGRLSLAGSVKTLNANLQGSGDLDAARLAADDADIYSETSGAVSLTARRSAKVRAAGVGEVIVGGNPACTVTGPAAGQVRCGG